MSRIARGRDSSKNAPAITSEHLRELYRSGHETHFRYLEHETRRQIRQEREEAALSEDERYAHDELRGKIADAMDERLERLRERPQSDSEASCLSSSHSCPQTVSIEEIAAISPELAADIEENFGVEATIEVVSEDAVHVIPDGVERRLGAIQIDGEDTTFDEISANVEFRHGGSRIKASRDRTRERGSGPEHGGGIRGTITGFSRAARKRLMDFVAELRRDERPYFVTLTYPDEFPREPDTWKNDLHKLLRRLSRRVENAAVVWRLELQRRKSGENKGLLAPHYHLLIYNMLDFDIETFVEEHWHDIAGNENAEHKWVHSKERGEACTLMQSWRHCAAYTAKELSKVVQSVFDTFTIEVDSRQICGVAPDGLERVSDMRGGVWEGVTLVEDERHPDNLLERYSEFVVISERDGEVLARCKDIEEARRVASWRVFVRNDNSGHVEAIYDGEDALERAETYVESRSEYPDGVGRFWGAWGRDYLPTVPALVVWVADAAAEKMLRIMEEHAGVSEYPYHKSMSVMAEASMWLRIFSRLLTGEEDADTFTVTVEALP